MKLSEAARKGMKGRGFCREVYFAGNLCCFLGAVILAAKYPRTVTSIFPVLYEDASKALMLDMKRSIPGYDALHSHKSLFNVIAKANDCSTLDDPRPAIADVLSRHGL